MSSTCPQLRSSACKCGSTGWKPSRRPARRRIRARPQRPLRRGLPWQGLMAASVAVMAVALGFLAADRWLQNRARAASPDYYTVTTPKPRAPNEVIRAVFSPDVTLIELQAILDEAQLRIVSGPTEAGFIHWRPYRAGR